MSDFLVSKLEEAQLDTVEDKAFDNLKAAEDYAQKNSLTDKFHLYNVKRKIDGTQYETMKTYKLGKLSTEIKSE